MTSLRLVIVEHPAFASEGLSEVVAAEPWVEIAARCRTGREGIAAIRDMAPDLVLLDLEMPDVDGFEVIETIGPDAMPPTIVVTAHDDAALRAFELRAFDYLCKPFGSERLREALARARAHIELAREHDITRRVLALAQDLTPEHGVPERFVVKSGGRVLFVALREIDWIESDGNYVHLHAAGRTHVVRETMASLEQRLLGQRFARVHRTRIVNLERVRELRARGNGEYSVVLADESRFRVGRAFRQELQEKLQRGR